MSSPLFFSPPPQDLRCSSRAQVLVCLAFSPQCRPEVGSVGLRLPCQSLCQRVADDCRQVTRLFSLDNSIACILECSRYPTSDCIGPDDPLVLAAIGGPTATAPTPTPSSTPNSTQPEPTPGVALGCPPAENAFFRDSDRTFALGWIVILASLCFLSTLLTVLTFLLDPSRFHYPWRPIVFLALSFNVHSLGYFFALVLGRSVVTCPGNEFITTSVAWRWVHTPCILVFGLLYYSMMAGFLWWLALTFCWFLSSVFKWSNEAVGGLSPFFHVVAWVLPLLLTVVLIAVRVVSADELTATCFLVRDTTRQSFLALLLGLIVPLFLLLTVGTAFVVVGFVSVLRIRSFLRHGGKEKETIILEKLMIRIGVFVAVYIVPATIVLCCFIYELDTRPHWVPRGESCIGCRRPNTAVFMVRILMFLLIGVMTGVWIWSRKTVDSWKMLPSRVRQCYQNRHRGWCRESMFIEATSSQQESSQQRETEW